MYHDEVIDDHDVNDGDDDEEEEQKKICLYSAV